MSTRGIPSVAQRANGVDQPIDVALRIASHASLIAGDVDLLPLTAVRQWSLELAQQLHGQAGDDAGHVGTGKVR